LIAALEKGWMAVELDSTVASDFALGASGRAVRAAEFFTESEVLELATAGESVAGDLGCPAVGSHKRSSAAESSKDHLSVAGPGLGSGKLQHWKLNCT
jgi:hypothetical protein